MLVRFFSHGKVKKGELTRTSGGGAVRSYLLFDKNDKRKPREGARLIYGNDVDTTEVINGIKNSKIYTSGVLSFTPEESITDEQKIEIIESFESTLFPNMTPGEYSGYWVEHQDKDRQELHFVYADIHLPTGKALPVYYHGIDLTLVDSWKDLINLDYNLADPNDPNRKRVYRLKGHEYAQQKHQETDASANLDSKKKSKIFIEEEIALHLIEAIASDERIQTHADVVALIGSMFEITRVAKDGKSISIKNPDGGRNIKLKGMIYEREFTRESLANIGRDQTKKTADRNELARTYQRERDKRQRRLEKRFAKYCAENRQFSPTIDSELTHDESPNDPRSSESNQSINPADEHAISANHRNAQADIGATDDHQDQRDQRFESVERAGEPGNQSSESTSQPDMSTGTGRIRADAQDLTAEESHADAPESGGLSAVLPRSVPQSDNDQGQVLSGEHGTDWTDAVDGGGERGSAVLSQASDQSAASATSTNQAANHGATAAARTNQPTDSANADRIKSFEYDRDTAQRPEPSWNFDYSKEPIDPRVWEEPEGQVGTRGNANIAGVKINETAYHTYRAHHQAFKDTIERFAQPNRYSLDADQDRTATTAQSSHFTISDDAITAAIEQTIEVSRSAATISFEAVGHVARPAEQSTRASEIGLLEFAGGDSISLETLADYIEYRRQRDHKLSEQFAAIGDQFINLNDGFGNLNEKQRNRHKRIEEQRDKLNDNQRNLSATSDKLGTATANLNKLFDTIRQVFKAVKQAFTSTFDQLKHQAISYADEGILYHMKPDGSPDRQATKQEAKAYLDSHPYDLENYDSLYMMVQRWKKEKEKKPKNEISGPGF